PWKPGCRPGTDFTARTSLHTRGSGLSVNGCVLAEHLSRAQVAKPHSFPRNRVDRDANFPIGNEKHIIGIIKVIDDPVSRLVGTPGTVLVNLLKNVRFETRK